MREDWDYISIDNYISDTKEIADRAGNTINKLKGDKTESEKRYEQLLLVLGAVINKSGGEVTIYPEDLIKEYELTREDYAPDGSITFTAKRPA